MSRPVVIDASAVVDLLVRGRRAPEVEAHLDGAVVHAPAVIDAEVLSAVARLARSGMIDRAHGRRLVDVSMTLPIRRVSDHRLVRRAYDLAGHLSTYDALYVALAEAMEAPLLTLDGKLARAPRLPVTVLHLA